MSAAETAEPVLDAASEKILEGIEEAEEFIEVVRNNPVLIALAAVLGVAAGGFGGYFLAKKKLRKFYEELADSEIAEAREFYRKLDKVDESGKSQSPLDVLRANHGEEAAEALLEYKGELPQPVSEVKVTETVTEVEVTEDPVPYNVFADATFDLEEEIKFRSPEAPYIITKEEFDLNESEYDQSALTYFEDDDVLIDENDNPIIDVDEVIGESHLFEFGRGSKEVNRLYIRNDRLELEYEITRTKGSFIEDVLGMPDPDNELRHSEARRAFRRGED